MDEPAHPTADCPRCGGRGARILYGLPAFGAPDLERELAAGRVVLGGCVVGPMTRQCGACGLRWRADDDLSGGLCDERDGPRIREDGAGDGAPGRWDAPSA